MKLNFITGLIFFTTFIVTSSLHASPSLKGIVSTSLYATVTARCQVYEIRKKGDSIHFISPNITCAIVNRYEPFSLSAVGRLKVYEYGYKFNKLKLDDKTIATFENCYMFVRKGDNSINIKHIFFDMVDSNTIICNSDSSH